MLRTLFAVAIALGLATSSPAVVVGTFPGLESLIDKADAIVILRIDRHVQAEVDSNLLSTHDCFVYHSLKGPIPAEQRITLRLLDPCSSFATPFSLGSTHLVFLTKKRSPDEPTDYRTLEYEGADVRLSPTGHEKPPVGDTVVDQVRSLVKEAVEFNDKEHAKEKDFLRSLLADSRSRTEERAPDASLQAEEYGSKDDIALAMQHLPTLDSAGDKAALKQQIEKAREEIQRRRKGHIIVGRVQVEGKDDPRDVNAQMEILSNGYFAGPTRDLSSPVGFRLHGYAPLDLQLSDHDGLVVDVGTIQMKRLPDAELAKLAGEVQLEDGGKLDAVAVHISTSGGPINTLSGGTDPRPSWPAPITVSLDEDGRFSKSGFSPIAYYVLIDAPGYVSQSRTITLSGGAANELGTIKLEKPRRLAIDYVVMKDGTFDLHDVKQTIIQGGDRWKIFSHDYRWDLEFVQEKGELYFKWTYGPVFLADLGEGELDEFTNIDASAAQNDPRKVAVTRGHVYLLRSGSWERNQGDRLTLFKIKTDH